MIDLLRGVREYVYPVGRLDFESEGLLLLTNDGELAARLTHPSHGVARVYEARVLGAPDEHDIDRLARGIVIDGRRTAPAEVERLQRPQPIARRCVITLREGRNRQVRKMCEAIGHPVEYLRRVAIGPLRDSRLKLGHWRDLDGRGSGALEARGGEPVRRRRQQRPRRAPRRRPAVASGTESLRPRSSLPRPIGARASSGVVTARSRFGPSGLRRIV